MSYYSREITMPKTRRDGLANFIQIVINHLEAGNVREALLQAVDLLQDVTSGAYDDAMTDAKGYSAIIREMEAKHAAEIMEATLSGFAQGENAEKARIAKALGLTD